MTLPTLIVHGGAGVAPTSIRDAQVRGGSAALRAGWRVLTEGGAALDAVCAAVSVLEDDPYFNAGLGSCLTSDGTVEMDATVMEGTSLRAGAVAVVRTVRHPVQLARALMEDGRCVMLAGPQTDACARAYGVETCASEDLIAPEQLRRWRQRAGDVSGGTVGAAAVDRQGRVASATSTGGLFYKPPGRVGDSAIIGAGTYADDTRGAASSTGDGEAIIRVALASAAVAALRDGRDPQTVARERIADLKRRVAGRAGLILVDTLGRVGYACNTEYMAVGFMRSDLADVKWAS